MGIGFAFTAELRDKQAFGFALDRAAERQGLEMVREENAARVHFCRMGELFLSLEEGRFANCVTLSGECQTNLLGAGFHAAAIEFVDILSEEAGLTLDMDDETDYYHDRDFNSLRDAHFYAWLSSVVEICRDSAAKGDHSGFCLFWPLDQYRPEDMKGTLTTPFGRFSLDGIARRMEWGGIESFAREFFLWNERERDARFYRGCALSMLWEDCCFMPGSRSAQDREINGAILAALERAAEMDPSVPFPKEEYALLCGMNGQTPIDVSGLPDYQAEYTIGYRRGTVTWKLGNLSVPVPGSYLFQYDESSGHGDHIWCDGLEENWHTIRMTAFDMGDGAAEFHASAFEGLFPEEFAVGEGWCRAAWAGVVEEDGERYEDVVAQVVCANQLTLVTISYEQPEERERAFSLLRGISARPGKEGA